MRAAVHASWSAGEVAAVPRLRRAAATLAPGAPTGVDVAAACAAEAQGVGCAEIVARVLGGAGARADARVLAVWLCDTRAQGS